jgi:formate C-acetyltransferase
MALRQAVFEEKRFSISELLDALATDYTGQEPMRQYLLNRIPKWGNSSSAVDSLAVRIAEEYAANIHSRQNARGGPFQAALFTLTHRIELGRHTGALPDGRKAGTSLAPSINPMPGMDTHGVTGLIGSASKLDFTETPNGSVLDITLHPSSLKGQEGLAAFIALIKTYFARGGYAIQANVVDADILRDAQRHPEKYNGLQIRVTGWSVYFTTLSKQEQDHFIARTAHMAG